jgi:hypothetical protein
MILFSRTSNLTSIASNFGTGSCDWVLSMRSGRYSSVLIISYVKTSIFCDITAYSSLKSQQIFRRNMSLLSSGSTYSSTMKWGWNIPPKRRLTFNGLYGVISQKMELFNVLFSSLLRVYRSDCPYYLTVACLYIQLCIKFVTVETN